MRLVTNETRAIVLVPTTFDRAQMLKVAGCTWWSDTGRIKVFFNKMQAPKTKFTFNVISYLAFLILFAYVLLFDLPKTVSTMEFVLMAWVLTVLVEEIRQAEGGIRFGRTVFTGS
ncbi:hypothetical protein DPMN_078670, partial [Dreissena polymorpha]